MINIDNISSELPFQKFKETYEAALKANQANIEAICISSFSKRLNEVNSRFVNLKKIIDQNFIFFTNYESVKSREFKHHKQVSITLFWNNINTQIRMKANISKVDKKFNEKYFSKRSKEKNALAISSSQSKVIESFEDIIKNYENTLKNDNLEVCPDHWGGFIFNPYSFEFWEGHEYRLNERHFYNKKDNAWVHSILQP
jgi:pyridoxamine 5'-phosphate oxidase